MHVGRDEPHYLCAQLHHGLRMEGRDFDLVSHGNVFKAHPRFHVILLWVRVTALITQEKGSQRL